MTAPAADAARDRPRRKLYTQLWFWVIVTIAAGIVFGLVAPDAAKEAKWLAEAFIQLIQTITGPVIFVTVVVGIASIGNIARAGGLALKAFGYFLVMTIVALTLGLVVGNLVQPGAGFEGKPTAEGQASAKESIGEAGDGFAETYQLGEGGLGEIADINEAYRPYLKDLAEGQTTKPIQRGSSTLWFHVERIERTPAKSLFEVQRQLQSELTARRNAEERERYIRSLLDKGIYTQVEEMHRRVLVVALMRYGR